MPDRTEDTIAKDIAVSARLLGLAALRTGTDRMDFKFGAKSHPTVGKVLGLIEEDISTGPADAVVNAGIEVGHLVYLRRAGCTRSIALMGGRETPLSDGDELILVHRFTGG
ncbi:MAG: hypothetical protein ACLFS8_03685 [Clostridia bacterium]